MLAGYRAAPLRLRRAFSLFTPSGRYGSVNWGRGGLAGCWFAGGLGPVVNASASPGCPGIGYLRPLGGREGD